MPDATKTTGSWRDAGRAWGARAADWAYLFEPYARPANEVVFDQMSVGPGARLLDVACGSGLAAEFAARRGAAVAGLDASEALVEIARARTPDGDFRVGDMFALPFVDASFDVVTSFNGIWKGCDAALREARRVLTASGELGLTFWGRPDRMDLLPYFATVIELSPPSHGEANLQHGDTGRDGVIGGMLSAAGFRPRRSGTVTVVNEWADVDIGGRELAAAGTSGPAIDAVGLDRFCDALRDVIGPLHVDGVGIRLTSEFGWVIADVDDPA